MIWSDKQLMHHMWAHELTSPYVPEQVNPASIDLRISNEFVDLVDMREYQADELTLYPGDAVLASTIEYIKMPVIAAGAVYLKSSTARAGLDHALAGWVDPGFQGNLTLELHTHRPITLKAGQRVVQLVLMQMMQEPAKSYQGRYQGQTGPTMARNELANA